MSVRAARATFTAAALVALAACGGGDDPAPQQGGAPPPGGNSNQPAPAAQESLNWAGYVKTGGIGAFTSISGSWIVPDVQCSGGNQNSSTWLGIGGGVTGDPTLIQAGTEQDCNGSEKFFGAWWEALPAPAIPAEGAILVTGSYPVFPGDFVTVTISSALVIWDISIANATQGWTFNTTVPYVAAADTAEWIVEAPLTAGTGGTGQLPIANFGRAHFSALTVNGGHPALTAAERMNMVSTSGATLTTASLPAASGDAFDVCYGAGPC
jgi:hypothetical protein